MLTLQQGVDSTFDSIAWIANHGMELLLVAVAIYVFFSIKKLHTAENSFDLSDLLMENGKASRISVIIMTTFAVTTWAFIYDVTKRKGIDVAILGAYGGMWIVPLVAKFFAVGEKKPASYEAAQAAAPKT